MYYIVYISFYFMFLMYEFMQTNNRYTKVAILCKICYNKIEWLC